MCFRFVAESTGHQISSRLLSMRSANALLELPASGKLVPAGTSVPAILISDIAAVSGNKSFPAVRDKDARHGSTSENTCLDKSVVESAYRVAILTVSDTVARGNGPDRRYFSKFDSCYLLVYLFISFPIFALAFSFMYFIFDIDVAFPLSKLE